MSDQQQTKIGRRLATLLTDKRGSTRTIRDAESNGLVTVYQVIAEGTANEMLLFSLTREGNLLRDKIRASVVPATPDQSDPLVKEFFSKARQLSDTPTYDLLLDEIASFGTNLTTRARTTLNETGSITFTHFTKKEMLLSSIAELHSTGEDQPSLSLALCEGWPNQELILYLEIRCEWIGTRRLGEALKSYPKALSDLLTYGGGISLDATLPDGDKARRAIEVLQSFYQNTPAEDEITLRYIIRDGITTQPLRRATASMLALYDYISSANLSKLLRHHLTILSRKKKKRVSAN